MFSRNSSFKAGAAVGDLPSHTEHGEDKGSSKGGAVESSLMLLELRGVSFCMKAPGDQTLVLPPRPGDVVSSAKARSILVLGKE